jgi:hypothetical protein
MKVSFFRLMAILLFMAANISAYSQTIVINEVMSSNKSAFYDEDGDTPDWIELYNNGDNPVNLSGFGLSDNLSAPLKWTFPGKSIESHGYLVVLASGKNRSGSGQWETIINWGDTWKYFVPSAELPGNWRSPGYDDSSWPSGPSGFGYGDDDDATVITTGYSIYIRKTFSIDQLPEILDAVLHVDYDDGFVAYLNGGEIARANIGVPGVIPAWDDSASVVIEPQIYQGGFPFAFQVNPSLILPGENVLAIEVHNYNTTSSDLTLIPFFSLLLAGPPPDPHGTPALVRLVDPMMHTNFKISSSGETVCLSDTSGMIIDSLQTGSLTTNVSRGRQPDGSSSWCYFQESTPGQSNNTTCYPGIAGTVHFSIPGGFYNSGIALDLSTDNPGDVIYYTLDGTVPDQSATVYSSTIYIFASTVVRAIGIHPGYLPARSVTNTYFFNVSHDLPVISISTSPGNFFDPDTGMYVDANIWTGWEKPIHVEFFDENDSLEFSVEAGATLYGGWTRNLPQKSMAIYARESYGDGEIDYKLFPDLPYDKYETFVLRNSGNDWNNTMFRDGLMTGLVAKDGIDVQAFRPAVVYINGDYWGIHNIREKLNDQYVNMHYGVPTDSLDLIELNDQVNNGDDIHYNQMISFIATHPLYESSNYEYIKTQMDVSDFITYEVAQIFLNNTDWPGNNIKYWRPRTPDGKWKWMLYDTDFGFGLVNDYTFNMLDFATEDAGPDWPNPPWSTFLLRSLLQNEDFRVDFINRYADLLNTSFRPDTIINQIDEKKSIIISEIVNHMNRWGGGDIWQWLTNVQVLRTFATQRPSHTRSHVIQYFGLSGVSSVTLYVDPPNAGTINISTLHPASFPWDGLYFNDVPVNLEAFAKPGYNFVRWEGNYNSESDSISLTFAHDMALTAVFEAYTPTDLVINEINYNSADDFNPGDWIELYNPNGFDVNLDKWTFKDEEDTHGFVMDSAQVLGGNGFLVLCEDTALFHSLFPDVLNYTGNFDFGLSGGGELLRLYDFSGLMIDTVHYDDVAPWPQEADGQGPSLELIDASFDNALPESWMASGQHGTPGNPNGIYIRVEPGIEQDFLDLRIVPNPMANSTNLLIISDKEQEARLEMFDYNGLRVWDMDGIKLAKGTHQIYWNGNNYSGTPLSSGIYICKLSSSSQTILKKIIKLN